MFKKPYLLPLVLIDILLVCLFIYQKVAEVQKFDEMVMMFIGTAIVTFLGVYLSFRLTASEDRKRRNDEVKQAYKSISRFVIEELSGNKGLIEDTLEINERTFRQMESDFSLTEKDKKMIQINVWKAAAEDLLRNLVDDEYMAMVNSGVFEKIPEDKTQNIKNAHTQMVKLKSRLQRL